MYFIGGKIGGKIWFSNDKTKFKVNRMSNLIKDRVVWVILNESILISDI